MWCLLQLLESKELISYPRPGNDSVLYSDEVIVGRVLNGKDRRNFWRVFWNMHPMRKLGDCHSNENGVEPGRNVPCFKHYNATDLRDGRPNTSLRNFRIAIGIDCHQHQPGFPLP